MFGGQDAKQIAETADCGLRWLHIDRMARLIVGSDRTILWLNLAAQQLIDGCADLDIRDQRLVLSDHMPASAFVAFLGSVDRDVCSLTLPCGDGDGLLLLQARRISAAVQPVRIGLVIHRTGSSYEPCYADFRRAFGLTASEDRIVTQLLEGLQAEEIAARSGSSVGTVRTHIRSIYLKLNVKSREQLFFRLRPFFIS